jgi:methyl-accepting chemotaxis protein
MALGYLLALVPAAVCSGFELLTPYTWLGFLLSGVVGVLVPALVLRPLTETVAQARKIFGKDIMTHIYIGGDDEFGRIELALEMLRSQLHAVTGRISDTTRHLTAAAGVTAGTAERTSQGVMQQQGELTQVATATTEMTATVEEVARNAASTAAATQDGQREADLGQEVVETTIGAIHTLADEVQQAGQVILELSKDSEKIGTIVRVIKEIAKQTKSAGPQCRHRSG